MDMRKENPRRAGGGGSIPSRPLHSSTRGVGTESFVPAGASGLTDVVRLRVRYSETDQMGITYHGRYMDWFVIGRTELLRTVGLPYARLEKSGLLLPVLEMNCQYLGATRYDDIVQLETTLTEVGRTRMAFRYEVWRLPPTVRTMPGSDG